MIQEPIARPAVIIVLIYLAVSSVFDIKKKAIPLLLPRWKASRSGISFPTRPDCWIRRIWSSLSNRAYPLSACFLQHAVTRRAAPSIIPIWDSACWAV